MCGRFVGFNDIIAGRAIRQLETPSSLVSEETYETLCLLHTGLVYRKVITTVDNRALFNYDV